MKHLLFILYLIWAIALPTFAQQIDTTVTKTGVTINIGADTYTSTKTKKSIKTFRPTRHFLGVRTGLGINSIGEKVNFSNFALDYDVVFRNSPIGLSGSFWADATRNGGDITRTVGVSGGLLFYIPYSKDNTNISGFAIKPRLDILGVSLAFPSVYETTLLGNYSEKLYSPFPYLYTHTWSDYTRTRLNSGLGLGAALSLVLESRFQIAKNLYASCGLESKAGVLAGSLLGEKEKYTIHNFKGQTWQESKDVTVYGASFQAPYLNLGLQLGLGFVFRGKHRS